MARSFFFVAILGLQSAQAVSQIEKVACRAIYSSDTKLAPLANWQNILNRPVSQLRPKLLEKLDAHPVVQRLKKKYGDGADLTFGYPVRDYRHHVKHGTVSETGWDIQGNFLGGVIDHIFPKAKTLRAGEEASDKDIETDLHDWTGTPQWRGAPAASFEMGILKGANPGPELPRKSILRQLMNLPEKAKIVSFYEGFVLDDVIPSLQYAKSILDAKLADIVILSSRNTLAGLKDQIEKNPSLSSLHLVDSKDWPNMKPEKGVQYAIWNGTFGQMNIMHKVADYSVVLGAGNIYEPLQEGRPVYFEKEPDAVVSRGTRDGWQEYADRAQQTGGAHAYKKIEDLILQIRSTSHQSPKKKVFETTNAEGLTPLDQILLQLEQILQRSSP